MPTISDARIAFEVSSLPLSGPSPAAGPDPIRRSEAAARARRSDLGLGFAVAALSLAALMVASPVHATADFEERFDEMTIGDLNGQAGWTCTPTTVLVVQGAGSDSSNVAHGDLGAGVAEAECFLPVAFHYTAADTAIVWSCWAKVGPLGCNKNAIAGPSGHHTPNGTVFGINVGSEQVPTTYVNCVGNQLGDALVFGHWYEIRVVVNFSVAGGRATLMYRDLTLGQPAFTVDALLRNVNLGLGTDVSGSFPFLQAYLRVDDQCAGVCYVDRLHIGAPGSSTAAVGPDAPASRWALAVAPDPARVAGPASVRFSLPGRSHVRITAFDTNGRRVGTLADEELAAGAYERRWNVRGDRGEPLGAGLYFVRLDAGAHVAVSKLVIVR